MKYLYDRNSVIIKDTSQVQFQETQSVTMKAVQYNPVAGRAFCRIFSKGLMSHLVDFEKNAKY